MMVFAKSNNLIPDLSIIKNSSINIKKQNNHIKNISIYTTEGVKIICGSSIDREECIYEVYNKLKELKIENIIEAGIGTGIILQFLPNINIGYKIIELNHELFEYFKDKNPNIIEDDFFNYIKDKNFKNTCFIVRFSVLDVYTPAKYYKFIFKYFKEHLGKGNILCLETLKIPFINTIYDYKFIYADNLKHIDAHMYIIKL